MSILAVLSAVSLVSVGAACQEAIDKGQQPGNACSYTHAQTIDAHLNAVWREAIPILREQDLKWEKYYENSGFFDLVLEEQRAWVRYREAVCAHRRFTFYNGSAAPWIYNECMVDMALTRIAYLNALAHRDQNPSPSP